MSVLTGAATVLTHPVAPAETTGARVLEVVKVISIAAADDDGSTYLIAEVPDMAVVEAITLETPAITGGTVYDVGLYDVKGNVIIDDVFATGLDLSTTTGLPTGPLGSPTRQATTNVPLASANKRVFEIAGHVNKTFPGVGETNRQAKYRIVLTADTIGSAAATIVARVKYLMSA